MNTASQIEIPGTDSRYQESGTLVPSSDLLTIAVRYKEPAEENSRLVERVVTLSDLGSPSDDQRFAVAVAMWAMLLNESSHLGSASLDKVVALLEDCRLDDMQSDFLALVKQSQRIIG